MAFKQIGVSMVVQGAAQFSRNIGNVAASLVRYAANVDVAQRSVLGLAKAQMNQAQKAMNMSVASVDRLTLAQSRYQAQLNSAQLRQVSANLILQRAQQALSSAKEGTDAYSRAQDRVTLASERVGQATIRVSTAQDNLTRVTLALAQAKGRGAVASKNLADAQSNLSEIGQQTSSVFGAFQQLLSVISGRFGENTIKTAGLTGAVMKLGLRVSGVVLALDLFKIGLDAVMFAGKLVMGTLQLVWNVFLKLGQIAINAGRALLDGIVKGLKALVSIPLNIVTGALNGLWQSIKRIGEIAIGMNISNLIWNFGTKLKAVGEMAFDAAGNFQLLTIRMTALLQREQLETSGIPFEKSLDSASKKSQEVLDWISKLGVRSIFSAEAIANVYTLGLAYDLTSEKSKQLTDAIVNFATGMGLQEDQMRRIIENFGQMQAAGKLTGTEMRDLARGAFVPINRILDQMGMNLGIAGDNIGDLRTKLQAMVTEGAVPVEEFFNAFIQVSNKDFPNAVDKAANSWEVVKSNIGDFIKTVIGWRVITPTLNLISKRMSDFIGKFMTDDMLNFAGKVGKGISFLATGFLRLSDNIGKALFSGRGGGIIGGLNSLLDGAADIARSLSGNASNIIDASKKIKDGISAIFGDEFAQRRGNQLNRIITEFIGVFSTLGTVPIGGSLKKLMDLIGETWSILWADIVQPAISKAWGAIKGQVSIWWENNIKPAMIDLWENKFIPWFSEFWNTTLPEFWNNTAGPKILELVNGLGSWVSQSNVGGEIGGQITSKILDFLNKNAGPGSQFAASVGSIIKSVFASALAAGVNALTGAGQEIANQPGAAPAGGEQAFGQHFTGGEQATGLAGAIKQLEAQADLALSGALGRFQQWARETFEPVDKLFSAIEAVSKIIGIVAPPMERIANAIARIVTANSQSATGGAEIGKGGAGTIAAIIELAGSSLDFVASGLETIAGAIEAISKSSFGKLFEGLALLTTPPTASAGIGVLFQGVQRLVVETATLIVGQWQWVYDQLVGNSIIPDMLNLMKTLFVTKLTEVYNFIVQGFISPVIAAFSADRWFQIGFIAMSALERGLKSVADSILSWFNDFKSQFHISITISVSTPTGEVDTTNWNKPPKGGCGGRGQPPCKEKRGTNFVIPPGFNENFLFAASSGEQVIVIPKASVMKGTRGGFAPAPTFSNTTNTTSSFSNVKEVNNYLTVNTSRQSNGVVGDFRSMRFLGE